MPPKKKPIAGPPRGSRWTPAEIAVLREHFPSSTNEALAEQIGRSDRSIEYCAKNLGLTKSHDYRSTLSRRTALATLTPEHMRTIGSAGGKIGGPARAESLSPAKRKKIAKAAIKARWGKSQPKSSPKGGDKP